MKRLALLAATMLLAAPLLPVPAQAATITPATVEVITRGNEGATIIKGSSQAVDTAVAALHGGIQTEAGYIYSCPAGSGAVWLDVYRQKSNLLGTLAYRFHQVLRTCFNGGNIVYGYTQRYSYVTNVDTQWQYHGLVGDGLWYTNGVQQQTSFMQGKFTNCLLSYGCVSSTYPTIKIDVWGYGGYWWTTTG